MVTTITGAGAHLSVGDDDAIPASKEGTKGYLTPAMLRDYILADAEGVRTALSVLTGAEVEGLIDDAVNAVVDGAPDALNTLQELAAALDDDENFAAGVASALAALRGNNAGAEPPEDPTPGQHWFDTANEVTKTYIDGEWVQEAAPLPIDTDTELGGEESSDEVVPSQAAVKAYADQLLDGVGDVAGPESATDGAFARFDGTTGKLIKGDITLDTDVEMAADSDACVPSQKAVKANIDGLDGRIGDIETLTEELTAPIHEEMAPLLQGTMEEAADGWEVAVNFSALRSYRARFKDIVNVLDANKDIGDTEYNPTDGSFVGGTAARAAIQAAIDYVESFPMPRGEVWLPGAGEARSGLYLLNDGVDLRVKRGVLIRGDGKGHYHDTTTAVNVNIKDAATALCWRHANAGKVIHFEPGEALGRRISGGGVVDLAIYGNLQAEYGVYARSVCHAVFDFYTENIATSCMYLGVVPAADGIVDEARDSQNNRLWISGRNTGATVGGSLLILDGDDLANASLNHIGEVWGLFRANPGMILTNCDNIIFDMVRLFRSAGTQNGIILRGGADAAQRCRAIDFKYISCNAPIVIEGYDDKAVPSTGHKMLLDRGNGTPLPTFGKGATGIVRDHMHDDLDGRPYLLNINGDFAFNQIGATSSANKTPGHDGCVVLTQSDPIAVTTSSAPEQGQAQCARLTQAADDAQRFAYLGVIESADTIPHRGSGISCAIRSRLGVAGNVHLALLEFTETADAFDAGVVNDWDSTDYTPGNFFRSGLNVLAHNVNAMSAGVWRTLIGPTTEHTCRGLTGTIGASANNLAWFVWVESEVAKNTVLDIGKVRVIRGYAPTLHVHEDRGLAYRRCARRVYKTYRTNSPPGTAEGLGAITENAHGAVQNSRWTANFDVPMLRTNPAVTIYSTDGTAGYIRDVGAGVNKAAATTGLSDKSVTIYPTENLTDNNPHSFHILATAYPWV